MILQYLQNLTLKEITLFNNILGLEIGEYITQQSTNKGIVTMPRFSLEIQSTYRFVRADKIIFGSYEGLFTHSNGRFVWILQEFCPAMIVSIGTSNLGDMHISFDNGLRLEVFNDTNIPSKNYRIYDNAKSNDYDEEFFDKAQNYIKIEKYLIRNL